MCREFVVQYGVKILSIYDSYGYTLLYWVVLGGYSEVIKFFINCGVEVNQQSRLDYGFYLIYWVCVNGYILCVDFFF